MTTRAMTRDELTDAALSYVRAGGRDTTLETAEQIVEACVDSMLGREDVPELRAEIGDAEIVRGALVEFVQQETDDRPASTERAECLRCGATDTRTMRLGSSDHDSQHADDACARCGSHDARIIA